MSGRGLAILLAALSITLVPRAQAQGVPPLPEKLTLPVLLRLVAERSPRLAAEQQSIAAAEAEQITAGVLPNPTVSYGRFRPSGGMNTLFDGTRQEQSTIDIPLLIAGQRGARIEAAEQGLLATRARVALTGSELALRAAEIFVGLQAAQDKVAQVQDSVGEIERARAIVSGRVQSGMASRYDLARVEMELATLAVRLDEAHAERAGQSAGLATLVGAPGWRPDAIGSPVPLGLPADLQSWRTLLAAGNPQIEAARREVEAAQATVKRVERERWPVPVLNLGRAWTTEPYGGANFVGVTTEVPLLDTRRGPLAKAEADMRAAERRLQAVDSEVAVELQRLLDLLVRRRAALEQFERKVGTPMPALKQMAEDAYRLGRGSILELIDASRSRLDARLINIDLRAAIVQQELRIKALAGKLQE
jgi:outer membrane protein, heavy metal efflux system